MMVLIRGFLLYLTSVFFKNNRGLSGLGKKIKDDALQSEGLELL